MGNTRRWDITFDSGPYTMRDKLTLLGVTVDLALVEPILAQVKDAMRQRQRVLTDEEVRHIATQVAQQGQ